MESSRSLAMTNSFLGFAEGSTQFSRVLLAELPPLRLFDGAGARALLEETFLVDFEKMAPPRFLRGEGGATQEALFVELFCRLGRQLLVDAGLPAFDAEMVVTLPGETEEEDRRARLTVPIVENVEPELYLSAYRAGFEFVSEFAQPSGRAEPLKAQADALEGALIKPIRQACNSGPSDIHLLWAAFKAGVEITHLGKSVYRLGHGARATIVTRSQTIGDSAIGTRTANDKWATLRWLRAHGVPIPRSSEVSRVEGALRAADHLGYPVVVKPANRDRSEGVSIDVMNETELRSAYEKARAASPRVLVETRVPGHCHRLVTFRGRFVFAFTRHPKAVVGDGEKSVAELVAAAEAARKRKVAWKADKPYPLDEAALACLSEAGLTPDSVPAPEQIVYLRRHNTPDDGGHNEIITDKVDPANIQLAERISRLFRLESMGLDLITTDPTRPWHETGGCITEVNSMPQIGENSARIYIETIFEGGTGAIPVYCYLGGDAAWEAARAHRERLAGEGVPAALTSGARSLDAEGHEMTFPGEITLFERVRMLEADPLAEALVVALHDDEILVRGRPMRDIAEVHRVDDALVSFREPGQSLAASRVDALWSAIEAGLVDRE